MVSVWFPSSLLLLTRQSENFRSCSRPSIGVNPVLFALWVESKSWIRLADVRSFRNAENMGVNPVLFATSESKSVCELGNPSKRARESSKRTGSLAISSNCTVFSWQLGNASRTSEPCERPKSGSRAGETVEEWQFGLPAPPSGENPHFPTTHQLFAERSQMVGFYLAARGNMQAGFNLAARGNMLVGLWVAALFLHPTSHINTTSRTNRERVDGSWVAARYSRRIAARSRGH